MRTDRQRRVAMSRPILWLIERCGGEIALPDLVEKARQARLTSSHKARSEMEIVKALRDLRRRGAVRIDAGLVRSQQSL